VVTLHLTINTSSVAGLSVSATDSVVSYGSNTTLTVNGGSLGIGASWKWYKDSCGGTSIGSGSSITVTIDGNATYYVRAEGTCNTTNCVSKAINLVEEIGISFYPNPASNIIHFSTKGKNPNAVEIYNVMGQRLIVSNWKTEMNIAQLSRGNYFIKYVYADRTITQKLIVGN
jgi:hypothetical protein